MGGVGGWLDTDNKTISVQLNLTGTELGNNTPECGALFISRKGVLRRQSTCNIKSQHQMDSFQKWRFLGGTGILASINL